MTLRKRVSQIVVDVTPDDWASRLFHSFIIAVIALNVIVIVVETVPSVHDRWPSFFRDFEIVSVLIYTVEYALRLWSVVELPEYARPIRGRLRFAVTPMALVDLAAILPFYIPAGKLDLRVVRVLRLFRLARVLKLARYSVGMQTLGRALAAKKEELVIILCVLGLLLVIASSLIFYAEHDAQPDRFSSIPASMWWAAITLTTVGYGDLYPVTTAGKIIGSFIAILGIGMFALPAGLLGASFVEEIQKQKGKAACPHCGKELTK